MPRTPRRLRFEWLEPRYALSSSPIDTSTRAAVIDAYYNQYLPALQPAANWTGSTSPCVPGTVDAAFTTATLDMINFYRQMAGLTDVTFDSTLSAKAQQMALMIQAQNALSHSPDSSWKCYTADGADAAGHSNIALGASGADAITLYMEDPGDFNTAVGHRRWLLYPDEVQMGSGSTSSANAVWVLGPFGSNPAPEWTAWPPAGYVPSQLVYPRWSLSRDNADFSAATVTMTVSGQPVPVTVQPVANGYGLNTLVWEPQALSFPPGSADQTVHVTVGNVLISGGARTYSYDVQVIDPAATGANTAPTISEIADQTGGEDVPLDVPFTVSDMESSATQLSVFVAWNNGLLLPNGSVTLSGTGQNQSLHIVPAANLSGSSLVTVTVSDGKLSSSKSFSVTFNAVNDPPTISPTSLADQFIPKNGNRQISLTIGDIDTPLDQLTLTADAADSVLLPAAGLVLSGSGTTRTLSITPASDQDGMTTVTLHLSDGQAETARTFHVLVSATSHPWQNPTNNVDVNGDGFVAPNDALIIINAINANGSSALPQSGQGFIWPPYYDVNGDDYIAPSDALAVINYINAHVGKSGTSAAPAGGEGEAAGAGLMLYLLENPLAPTGKRKLPGG
jgi:uncharacterized protein YkwD